METMGRTKRPHRSFSSQFKAEVVDLVRQPGNTPASVARDLDLTESAVRGWVHQAEIDDGGRDGLSSAERARARFATMSGSKYRASARSLARHR